MPQLLCDVHLLPGSRVHGQGLFAKKDFNTVDDFIPVSLEGSFEVHDSLDDCLDAAKKNGISRFKVCDNMPHFLFNSEVSRPTSALYLVPDRTYPKIHRITFKYLGHALIRNSLVSGPLSHVRPTSI